MLCQVCKIPLREEDKHTSCILHRKCSKDSPCALDKNESPDYWSEIDLLLAAAKCAGSPTRKSLRVAKSKSSKMTSVTGEVTGNPGTIPPLHPKKPPTPQTSSSSSISKCRVGKNRRGLILDRGSPSDCPSVESREMPPLGPISKKSAVIKSSKVAPKKSEKSEGPRAKVPRISSDGSRKSVGSKNRPGKESGSKKCSVTSGEQTNVEILSRQIPEKRSGSGPVGNDVETEMTEEEPSDPVFVPTSIEDSEDEVLSEVEDSQEGIIDPVNRPFSTQESLSRSTIQGMNTQSMGVFGNQFNAPLMGQSAQVNSQAMGQAMTWQQAMPGQWQQGQQPWMWPWCPPMGQWFGGPNQPVGPMPMNQSASVVTSQPPTTMNNKTSVRKSVNVRASTSRSNTVASSTFTRPRAAVSNDNVAADYDAEQDLPSDNDDSSIADDMSMQDVYPLLQDEEEEELDLDDGRGQEQVAEAIKVLFSADRINPILKAAAQAAGAEVLSDDKPESSLLYGNLGQPASNLTPILSIPNDVHTLQSEVFKSKGALDKSVFFQKALRVPEEDYQQFFATPKMDNEALIFVKNDKLAKQRCYLPALETQFVNMDKHVRVMSRLATFQLMIMNALSIGLSDGEGQSEQATEEPDSLFNMSKLSAALAGQQLRYSMRMSQHLVKARRDNVYFGIRGKRKDELLEKLKKVEFDSTTIFGGKFAKICKKVAKDIKHQEVFDEPSSEFSGKPRGSGNYRRNANRGQRYRGRGRAATRSNFGQGSDFSGNRGRGYTSNNNFRRGQRGGRSQGRFRGGRSGSRY